MIKCVQRHEKETSFSILKSDPKGGMYQDCPAGLRLTLLKARGLNPVIFIIHKILFVKSLSPP